MTLATPIKLLHVVGARPNFMKAAPVLEALQTRGVTQVLVHTGQHYDAALSDVFFQQLGMPQPDVNLGVGSGSHAQQTAAIIQQFEPVLQEHQPDCVIVYGDVNSTIATALVASKLGVKIAHVEAGLRSFDRSMPEEINRILTDQLADLLFTPSEDGDQHLAKEGISASKIFLVGNVMIDTLVRMKPAIDSAAKPLQGRKFVLVTLHRPANVDDFDWLARMFSALRSLAADTEVVFPVHPRTRERLKSLPPSATSGLRLIDPLPYVEFLAHQKTARLVITDSGGVQEETTYLGIPCITVRDNTERPITITVGTNQLVGRDVAKVGAAAQEVLSGKARSGGIPPLWDGKAAERIADVLVRELARESVGRAHFSAKK
jgi:UDP-N-acetylglucosamine 2-epimerase (non-hydrolysing)